MSVCAKCDGGFNNKEVIVCCTDCKKQFHPSCTKLESIDQFKKLSAKKRSAWKCEACSSETASVASDLESTAVILESIQGLRFDMNSQLSEVCKNVEGVKKELTTVNSTIGILQTTMSTLLKENEERKAELEKVGAENKELKEVVGNLSIRLNELDQYSRRDNVEIVGVPFSKGENVYSVLDKIAKVINVQYNWEVSTAHRLAVTKERPNPAIIVRFISRDCKVAWMKAAKENRRKLTAAELANNWQSTPIYINDHLTTYYKSILGRGRRLTREKKLAFVWSRDCKLFARKSAEPGSPVKLLRSMDDLEQLLSQ